MNTTKMQSTSSPRNQKSFSFSHAQCSVTPERIMAHKDFMWELQTLQRDFAAQDKAQERRNAKQKEREERQQAYDVYQHDILHNYVIQVAP